MRIGIGLPGPIAKFKTVLAVWKGWEQTDGQFLVPISGAGQKSVPRRQSGDRPKVSPLAPIRGQTRVQSPNSDPGTDPRSVP